MRLLAIAGSALALGILAFACGEPAPSETKCTPGQVRRCLCKDGNFGTTKCKADGSGDEACISEDGRACDATLCEPGSTEPCTCPGGEKGERACSEDGARLDECRVGGAPCPSSSSSSSGGGSGGSGGSGGGGGTGTKELFEACASGSECASGKCPMGYCTKDCGSAGDCPSGEGQCVKLDNSAVSVQVCMPLCLATHPQCEEPFGASTKCGYAATVEGTKTAVCARWEELLTLPPDGAACDDENAELVDFHCHLGHIGMERICVFGGCTDGCREDLDCPSPLVCSGKGGNPGSCVTAGN